MAEATQAHATRLAGLRRLYLHVLHGGTLTPVDLTRTDNQATAEGISRLIQRMEREPTPAPPAK